jgi:hypothetical protein
MSLIKNINKSLVLSLFLVVFAVTNIYSAQFDMISDIGTSAAMIGRANIQGFTNEATVVFENPASLVTIDKDNSISLFATTIMNEVHYNNISYSKKTPWGTFGVGYLKVAVFGIDETAEDSNENHVSIGTFDYGNSILKLAYQKEFILPNTYFGVALNQYSHQYYSIDGSGTDFDLGLYWDNQAFDCSVVLRNLLGSDVTYNNDSKESLPREFITSALIPLGEFNIYSQLRYKWDNILPSIAVSYRPEFLSIFQISGGYKQSIEQEAAGKATFDGLTLGIALFLYDLQIHYAFEKNDHPEFDNKSYISVSMNF